MLIELSYNKMYYKYTSIILYLVTYIYEFHNFFNRILYCADIHLVSDLILTLQRALAYMWCSEI